MTVFKYKNGKLVQVAGNSGGGSSGSTIPPDTELSEISENAVQNKVITEEFNKKANQKDLDTLENQFIGVNTINTETFNKINNKLTSVNNNMLGIPSNTGWINISITGESFYYKAPKNGYIRWTGHPTNTSGLCKLFNIGTYAEITDRNYIKVGASASCHSISGDALCATVPCKQGDNIYIYVSNTSSENIKFIPAEEV